MQPLAKPSSNSPMPARILRTTEELGQFLAEAQPAGLQFITEKIGKDWVEKALKGADDSEKVIGTRADGIVQETIDYANKMLAETK